MQTLFVFIEGGDDTRFFQRIIQPIWADQGRHSVFYEYAQKTHKKVAQFLNAINRRGNEYIYLTDMNLAPCITLRKQRLKSKIPALDASKILVVKAEIEGWYLAGLDVSACKKLGINAPGKTDSVTKEQFEALMHQKFSSKIDFMQEILNHYSLEVAVQKNVSFQYFVNKQLTEN